MNILTWLIIAWKVALTYQATAVFPVEKLESWKVSQECPGVNNGILFVCAKKNCDYSSHPYPVRNVKAIHLTINVLIKPCNNTCSEKFTLNVLHGNTVRQSFDVPENPSSVKPVGDFKNFSIVTTINDVQGYSDGIKFRFDTSKHFCGTFNSVSAKYNLCPASAPQYLLAFDVEPAPEKSKNLTVKGKCMANSDIFPGDPDPYMKCKYDGKFKVVGECYCNAGFERSGSSCKGIVSILNTFLFLMKHCSFHIFGKHFFCHPSFVTDISFKTNVYLFLHELLPMFAFNFRNFTDNAPGISFLS